MTPGTEPALTPDEWLGGINRGTSAGGRAGGRVGRRTGATEELLSSSASFLHMIPCPRVPFLPHSQQAWDSDMSLYSPAYWMTVSPLPPQIPC